MFRLKIKAGKKWRVGIKRYTAEEAHIRKNELFQVSIISKVFGEEDLFNENKVVVW